MDMRKMIAGMFLLLLLLAPFCLSACAEKEAGSPQEFHAQVESHLNAGEEEFTIVCPASLFDSLKDEGLNDIMENSGIHSYRYRYSDSNGTMSVSFHDMVWYPGKKILVAVRTGTEQKLTPREKQTLEEARRIVSSVRGTEAEIEKQLHDHLCERVTYLEQEGEFSEKDNATGALLNGYADCDGYSDAFYLLCGLSGIEARHQHGTTSKGKEDSTHMWNNVRIDGRWYMVDVTWDDKDPGISYLYFDLGSRRMGLDHFWKDHALNVDVAYDPEPVPVEGVEFGTAASWDQLFEVIRTLCAHRAERIRVYFSPSLGMEDQHDRLNTLSRLSGISDYSWSFAPDSLELHDITYYEAFGYFTDEQQAVDFINRQDTQRPPREMMLSFSDSLGSFLYANDRAELRHLLYSTDLEAPDWTFWNESYRILIKDASYVQLPTMYTEAQLKSWLRQVLANRPYEICFRYGGELDFSNGIEMLSVAVRSLGVGGTFSYNNQGGCRMTLYELEFYPEFLIADTYDQVAAYVRSCKQNGRSSFRVYCPESLYWQLEGDNARAFFGLLKEAGFTSYSVSHNDSYCVMIAEDLR